MLVRSLPSYRARWKLRLVDELEDSLSFGRFAAVELADWRILVEDGLMATFIALLFMTASTEFEFGLIAPTYGLEPPNIL